VKTFIRIALMGALGLMLGFLCSAQTIDFTKPLTGIDGKPIAGGQAGQPLTLSDVAVGALQAQLQTDAQLPGAKKFEMYDLARKVFKCKSCTLTLEERTLLKERIGQSFGAGIVGPAWEILDPSVKKEPAKP
jgi:hypothetical protein